MREARVGERVQRWWRRFNRSPLLRDLRIIKIEHRHLYRERLESGDLGKALNALWNAYLNGHLKEPRP